MSKEKETITANLETWQVDQLIDYANDTGYSRQYIIRKAIETALNAAGYNYADWQKKNNQ